MIPSEAFRLVALLNGAYPRVELPASTAEVYALALADVSLADASRAVVRLIRTSRWLPTVAEIREVVCEERLALPAPDTAWLEVTRAIAKLGQRESPPWSCPELAEAVRTIGWSSLCNSTNPAAERARFLEAYAAIRGRRMQAELAGDLSTAPILQLVPGAKSSCSPKS